MRRRLTFERLEKREMLDTKWIAAGSGLWSNASDWSNGVPTGTVDAIVNPSSPATITIQPGETDAAQSLTLGSNAVLSMQTGSDPSLPTSNLVANPGFESPTATNSTTQPSNWGCSGSAYLSTQYACSGAQSLVLSGNNSSVNQTFSAAPNTPYTVSVDAMTPASNPLSGSLDVLVQVYFFSSSWGWLGYGASTTIMSSATAPGGPLAGSVGNQGWNRYFVTTSAAPSNAAYVTVQLQVYASSSSYGGAACFDAAQFGPAAPGPSTLALGSLVNNGSITIGPTNQINVSGGFTQGSTGALDVQLRGGAQEGGSVTTDMFGSLTVTGAAALGGTLEASLVYGYVPTTTDTFTPISYASETGNFAAYTLPSGSGYQFEAATSFTNVVVSAAPSAATTTTVSVGTVLHTVAANLLGVNLTGWDLSAVSAQTQQMVLAAGLNTYRFPGGSASDGLHFNLATWELTVPQFALGIESAGGSGMATLDYGSGSPQEAAAEVAYLLGSPNDKAALGEGLEWMTNANNGNGAWEWVNWQTAGYWASLRAASPLAVDDGYNFLRIGHPAPFSTIKYFEVGNEVAGSWETDYHGTPGPGGIGTGAAHDAATYATFCYQFAALAQPILAASGLPSISIGVVGDVGDTSSTGWTNVVLTTCKADGFVPGFIIDHSYMQSPGYENDSYLLNDTVSDPYSDLDWSTRYNLIEKQLQQALGSQASSVAVMATEFNSVSGGQGKQTTNLVNGLFIANALGGLMDSGYSGATVWDLRNGISTGDNDSNLLYGWRQWGDYGLVDGYIPYPNYFAEELASKLIVAGGQVVSAASNYGDLDVYAVRQSNSHLDLLVINTNPAAAVTSQFNVTGFQPAGPAQVWQYGKAEDLAQSQSSTGTASLTYSSTTLSLSGANFSYTFPSYSMTVLDLTPSQTLTSVSVTPAAARVAPGKTVQFTATAYDQYGDVMATQPTFNWSLALGAGNINSSSGLYTAPPTTGSASVQASGGLSATASVTTTNTPPTVATQALATPNPVTGSTAALSVLGADGGGQASLSYTWSALSVPAGATVMFSANGSNAAQNTIATFNEWGVYNLEATITNLAGLTVTSKVSVTVDQTLTSIAVSPGNVTLAPNSQEQLTATAYDQFGNAMASQPSFVWSTSNATQASIGATGLYTAGNLQGIATVTATIGALNASATIDVTSLPAPLAWYRFNEGGGYTALDSGGNGYSGTISSSENYDTSAPTGADLVFNGSSGNVNLGEPSGLNITGKITLSAWVDPAYSSPPGGDYDIVGRGYSSNAETELRIENGNFEVGSWNGAANYYAYYPIPPADLNTWSLLTGVYDGSTWRLYLNGQPVGTTVTTTVGALAVPMDWMIGSSGDSNRYFDGGIGDVRIYNVGLSATQAAQLYDSYYPPTVATAAAASPATVTGKTTTLSVQGASSVNLPLTYTWSAIGTPPAAVAFSPNGANAANSTVATFSKAGTYTLGVTIADTYGQFTTSSVNVTVNQTLTSVAVALAANNLATTGVEQFTATSYDQFNYPMVNQPTFSWGFSSLVGGGLIDSSGDFQPPYAVGSAVISATAGGKTGQTTATYPGVAQWNSAGGLSWTGGSWIGTTSTAAVSPPGLRAAASDYAQFATSGGTISLGGVNPSLAGLSFASANSYTLSGGAMKLSNGASPATIGVSSGNHTIVTPVTLQSNLDVTVLSGDSLTISGGVSGSGESLTLNGPGKLVLGGNNSFSGVATVLSGTLVVSGPSALPNGSNLAVGANLGKFSVVVAASTAFASAAAVGVGGPSADAAASECGAAVPAAESAAETPTQQKPIGVSPIAPNSRISPAALDAAIAAAVARRSATDVTWFGYVQSEVASAGQKDSRSTALQALDAVLAAYSQD